jgi:orotidine-5'-phosphate decarboxylase
MSQNVILHKLALRSETINSFLCVGLDPDTSSIPSGFLRDKHPLFAFNRWIIDQTHSFTSAYKPNMAFYEALGPKGMQDLELTMEYLRTEHPSIVTICDAKRGDIGNTNYGYVSSIFGTLGFDAVTLHPYMGQESLAPFLERSDKACIILCRTSNPGAGEFQDLLSDGKPLWESVAYRVASGWNTSGNCMLVVGATYPQEMKRIRSIAPRIPFLVPGIGAQGGDIHSVVMAGIDETGGGLLISSSRAVLMHQDPASAARELRDEINIARLDIRKALNASS